MYTWLSLRKPSFFLWLVYIILVCSLNMWLFALKIMFHTQLFALQSAYTYCACDWCLCNPCIHVKNAFFEVWVVWGVMQLNPSVVTTFPSTLSLQKHMNRGREVHERRLELLHCHTGGIVTLFPPTFSLVIIPLCCRAWRLSSLEKRSNRTRSRFREVLDLKRRYNCTYFHD